MNKSKLIFGCGYLGSRVADLWLENGGQVFAVTRSAARVKQLQERGLTAVVADINQPKTLHELPQVETVLFAVGYDRSAGRSIHEVYVGGLGNVLDALPAATERIVYVSSTGVYGQADGGWVDEESECRPTREGGRACLDAEGLLAAHPQGKKSIVLRMAGIYGPGRVPRRRDLESGRPIPAPAHGYLNLIHVDDAARVVLDVERKAFPPQLYLVADGNPVSRREYFRYLAQLISAPEPQFVEPKDDSPAAKRATADKRISNRKLIDEIGVELQFPSYQAGLKHIVESESAGN